MEEAHAGEADDHVEDLATGAAKYCTPSYVAMEAGISWIEFGQPDRAVETFENALASWPATSQLRDRGLCLARLATASAASGDRERALAAGTEALPVAHATGSARIRAQLVEAYDRLLRLGISDELAEFRHQLEALSTS